MTNEEKLKHFEDSVIGRANELSEESLKEFQETLDKEGKEYRDEKNQRALANIKSEIGNLKRERNSVVARQQIDLKRQLTERTEELTAQLFEEVNEKLRGFRQTPDYLELLEKQIESVKKIADGRDFTVYLSPEDEGLKAKLQELTGTELRMAETSFGGGIRGYVDHERLLVDNSFAYRLEELRENFTFDTVEGGTSHE